MDPVLQVAVTGKSHIYLLINRFSVQIRTPHWYGTSPWVGIRLVINLRTGCCSIANESTFSVYGKFQVAQNSDDPDDQHEDVISLGSSRAYPLVVAGLQAYSSNGDVNG